MLFILVVYFACRMTGHHCTVVQAMITKTYATYCWIQKEYMWMLSIRWVHTVELFFFSCVFNFHEWNKPQKLNPSKFGPEYILDTSNYCARYKFDSVFTAVSVGHSPAWQLQQCDWLVLAISCEIEPLHVRKRKQLWVLSWASNLHFCCL